MIDIVWLLSFFYVCNLQFEFLEVLLVFLPLLIFSCIMGITVFVNGKTYNNSGRRQINKYFDKGNEFAFVFITFVK